MPKITKYTKEMSADRDFRITVVADLHSNPEYEKILLRVRETDPDIILIPGDLCHCSEDTDTGQTFLRGAAKISPVLYSFGNHERFLRDDDFLIPGVTVLNSRTARVFGVTFGGLRSGYVGQHETSFTKTPKPDTEFLDAFGKGRGSKILLSHHPEYYEPYLRDRDIDLIISGHAHGGQWCVFGKGIFAPGQGLFPKYTHGICDGRLIVSRGVTNTVPVPRFGNPTEIVVIDVKKA